MQVTAVSTPDKPGWRWRIVDTSGEMVEESRTTFTSIAAAVADGTTRLTEMNVAQRPSRAPRLRTRGPSRGPTRREVSPAPRPFGAVTTPLTPVPPRPAPPTQLR
jgi:hypothetical protein